MATPADLRLLEVLEKWLKSLELHIRYSSLDSDSYAQIQPWPEHQRPSRWIIDLAIQKTLALRAQVQERIKAGDTKFSDSLELMTFLANLVGSEHIERFIPMADPHNERVLPLASAAPLVSTPADDSAPANDSATANASAPANDSTPPNTAAETATGTREMPAFAARRSAATTPADAATGTREMPEFVAQQRPTAPVATARVARTERKPAVAAAPASREPSARAPAPRAAPPPPRAAPKQPAKLAASSRQAVAKAAAAAAAASAAATESHAASSAEAAREQVIGDAARLVQWGRKWYELAELIARMADRPPLPEVRRILKDNKTAIEKKAGRS